MSRTRVDLVDRTAKLLGVIGAGQTLAAEDRQSIDDEIDGMMATLETESIYRVGDDDQIDDAAFYWLACVLAVTCAPDFGFSEEGLAKKGVTRAGAESRLRKLSAVKPTGSVQRAEYF